MEEEVKKEVKIINVDFHTHALNHKHYPVPAINSGLSVGDKKNIAYTLEFMKEQGRDAVAITDHNQLSSALYALKLADKVGIKVIPGMEVSMYTLGGFEYHVLALGLGEISADLTEYFRYYSKPDLLAMYVHAHGGITIMSHPQYYPRIFDDLLPYYDGYEIYNGGSECRGDRMTLTPDYVFEGFETMGSDWHLGPDIKEEQKNAMMELYSDSPLYKALNRWL